MKAGDIFYCSKFTYKNGETGKKLLVLLNSPINDEPFIICKTTSQSKNKPTNPGCHPNLDLFLILKKNDYFNENTWLQFYELYEFDKTEFFNLKTKCGLEYKSSLKNITVKQIINCLKKCKGIIKYHLELILKR